MTRVCVDRRIKVASWAQGMWLARFITHWHPVARHASVRKIGPFWYVTGTGR